MIRRKHTKNFLGCFPISMVCFLFRWVITEINGFTVYFYAGGPCITICSAGNAAIARRIVYSRFCRVMCILPLCSKPQITPPIVRGVLVFVIYTTRRPFACLVCPDNNVRTNQFLFEAYCDPAIFCSNAAPRKIPHSGVSYQWVEFPPSQFACKRVVKKVLTYLCRIYIFFEVSHARILNFPIFACNSGKF